MEKTLEHHKVRLVARSSMATSCIAKSMKRHTPTESRSISNRAIVSIAFDLPEQRADDLRRRALAGTVGD